MSVKEKIIKNHHQFYSTNKSLIHMLCLCLCIQNNSHKKVCEMEINHMKNKRFFLPRFVFSDLSLICKFHRAPNFPGPATNIINIKKRYQLICFSIMAYGFMQTRLVSRKISGKTFLIAKTACHRNLF